MGFTIIELLAVIGVISLLLSLLLPAVMNSRASARRLACTNHLRQLALALSMHADLYDRLPASGNFEAKGARKYHSWVVSILPQIDQGDLARSYDLNKPSTDPDNLKAAQLSIPVLVCPDDVSVEEGQGNLTYVVSGGLAWTIPVDCPASVHSDQGKPVISPIDFNGDGQVCPLNPDAEKGNTDASYLDRTSLFFVENWPLGTGSVRHHRLADVLDGTSQTILLSENLRAGYDPQTDGTSWAAPDPLRNMFFVSSYVCENRNCGKGKVNLSRANDHTAEPYNRECLNASRDQPEGTAPWPSSGHLGMVNFAYCDGHVVPLSERIDGKVYFALITPQGLHGDEPLAEATTGAF
jgi:prepilin-type processing-associated H-X9-DG protein